MHSYRDNWKQYPQPAVMADMAVFLVSARFINSICWVLSIPYSPSTKEASSVMHFSCFIVEIVRKTLSSIHIYKRFSHLMFVVTTMAKKNIRTYTVRSTAYTSWATQTQFIILDMKSAGLRRHLIHRWQVHEFSKRYVLSYLSLPLCTSSLYSCFLGIIPAHRR